MLLLSAGKYDNYYWTYILNTLQEWTDEGELSKKTNNSVFIGNTTIENILAGIVNCGVRDVGIGSIRWKGDAFETKSATIDGLIVKGKLLTSAGKSSEMQLKYGQNDWLVTYDYSKTVGVPFLPWRWTLQAGVNENLILNTEVQIVTIELGSQMETRDAFSLNQILQSATVLNRIVLTNNAKYFLVSNGVAVKFEKVPSGLPLSSSELPKVSRQHVNIARGVIVVLIFSLLIYVIFRRVTNKRYKPKMD